MPEQVKVEVVNTDDQLKQLVESYMKLHEAHLAMLPEYEELSRKCSAAYAKKNTVLHKIKQLSSVYNNCSLVCGNSVMTWINGSLYTTTLKK